MESEWEKLVRERTAELEVAIEMLRHRQRTLTAELEAVRHVATQLISAEGIDALYDEILDTALKLMRADFASIQIFYPERGEQGELRLLGHRGFNSEAVKDWEWVGLNTCTACGEALRTRRRVVVPDVRSCNFMVDSPELKRYIEAGILAAQTTPLVSLSGTLLGMVSTHWREPHELSPSEAGALDILARLAADAIERSRAEEKLRESEKLLQNAERLAHIGHWAWDLRLNSVSGSEEMYRIFGKPADHVPSYDGFLEDLLPADRERLQELIQDSLTNKVGHSLEYRVANPSGEVKTISCIWEVLLDEDGSPVRIFGTCQDVTEGRRIVEQAFARQKLEIIGTLASGIAHDFNNLLGGVLAQAELALAELAAGGHPEAELHRIRNVAIQGADIVRQLMIYAGKESEDLELVDISRIVAGMFDLLNVSVSKHAALEIDLGKNLPRIKANAAQLRQIVMNLVTNASEAIEGRDGVIRVITSKASLDSDGALSKGIPEGDYLILQVSDDGRGISPEMRARVFDPFVTTKAVGRGLGLAVVQGIVRKLEGAINVVSRPGKGATFQIWLPAAAENSTAERARGVAGEHERPSKAASILVIEDEHPLRQAIGKMLRHKGFEVHEAANGSAAIDLLRAKDWKIDAILLDMTIPGHSSQEIVTEVSRISPDVKVILTSAYSEEMVTAQVSAPVICGFIRKPFQFDDLVKMLQDVLSL